MNDINNKDEYINTILKNIEKAKHNLEVAKDMLKDDHFNLKDQIINKYETQIEALTKLKDNLNKH